MTITDNTAWKHVYVSSASCVFNEIFHLGSGYSHLKKMWHSRNVPAGGHIKILAVSGVMTVGNRFLSWLTVTPLCHWKLHLCWPEAELAPWAWISLGKALLSLQPFPSYSRPSIFTWDSRDGPPNRANLYPDISTTQGMLPSPVPPLLVGSLSLGGWLVRL